MNKTKKQVENKSCTIHGVMCSASKRRPWNWGKRKPVEDDCGNKWCNGWSTDENDFLPFMGVIIPKGTIEKIIGRKITWEDEPVEVRF